jgi:hypothetical protein
MGPIPHHMHQNAQQAALVHQQGKPESYYFPPQLNYTGNNFPYTFFGLEPGTQKSDVRRCLENWNKGDNGIVNHSEAYRLRPGAGWLVPPCILHAPGLPLTYEPQWGSDEFGMYQSTGRRPFPATFYVAFFARFPKTRYQRTAYFVLHPLHTMRALDGERDFRFDGE